MMRIRSLDLRGLRPWAALAAVACLLLFDQLVARRDRLWAADPASQAGIVDVLEKEVISRAAKPEVVVLGDSRLRDAVAPRQLESELGLERGTVLNLALTGGTPFDSLTLYRRNRGRLREASVLVIGVENWYTNAMVEPGPRVRRFADLDDRVGVYSTMQTVRLLIGWAWATFDAADILRHRFEAIARPASAESPLCADGRVKWRGQELEIGPDAPPRLDRDIDMYYRTFRIGKGQLAHLGRLVGLARADGMRVMLVRVPWRDAYLQRLRERYEARFEAADRALREFLEALPDVETYLFGPASAQGIPENYFYDYGHMTKAGERWFTALLASLVK